MYRSSWLNFVSSATANIVGSDSIKSISWIGSVQCHFNWQRSLTAGHIIFHLGGIWARCFTYIIFRDISYCWAIFFIIQSILVEIGWSHSTNWLATWCSHCKCTVATSTTFLSHVSQCQFYTRIHNDRTLDRILATALHITFMLIWSGNNLIIIGSLCSNIRRRSTADNASCRIQGNALWQANSGKISIVEVQMNILNSITFTDSLSRLTCTAEFNRGVGENS